MLSLLLPDPNKVFISIPPLEKSNKFEKSNVVLVAPVNVVFESTSKIKSLMFSKSDANCEVSVWPCIAASASVWANKVSMSSADNPIY